MRFHTLGSLLIAGVVLIGCGSSKETAKAPDQHADHQTSAPEAAVPIPSDAAILGTKVEKEHYAVNLKTEPAAPKMGKTNFVAEVWHHGEPASGVRVRVETSMPSMKMEGPGVDLKATTGNVYEGVADLPMGGEYQATVLIAGGEGHSNEFTYKFDVSQ